MITAGFQVVKRKIRAVPLIARIRRCSRTFKAQLQAGDTQGMQRTSKAFWDAAPALFESLRNEEDHGNLPRAMMRQDTALLASNVTLIEQAAMIAAKRIDRSHPSVSTGSLRDALNKFAHYNNNLVAFRVDRRGAHYLVLGGSLNGRHWVLEVLVEKLCRNAARAARSITP